MELKREIRKRKGVGMVLSKFKNTGQNFVFCFSPESLSFLVATHTPPWRSLSASYSPSLSSPSNEKGS